MKAVILAALPIPFYLQLSFVVVIVQGPQGKLAGVPHPMELRAGELDQ